MELAVTDPVTAINSPSVPQYLHQSFWGGTQVGEKQALRLKWLAVSGAGSGHLQNSAGANPAFADVLWCLLCPQRPGDVASIADLLLRCHKEDRAFSLELVVVLTMQRIQVALLLR